MSSRQIERVDNSLVDDKIVFRIRHIKELDKVNVLDAFHGAGVIWGTIKNRLPEKEIDVLGIDKQSYDGEVQLIGDNVKYLAQMDLQNFNVIDLDAYGIPYLQFKIMMKNPTLKKGTRVFMTFIQSLYPAIAHGVLSELGYPPEMVRKCPALFYRNSFNKWLHFLGNYGIKNAYTISLGNRHYQYIKI